MLATASRERHRQRILFFQWEGRSQNVLTRVEKTLHSLYLKSGVRGAHNQRFRHTMASDVLARGGTVAMVADILAISIGVAEKHYIKWTEKRQENLWEVMQAIQKPQSDGTRRLEAP